MKCKECGAKTPDNKKYCIDCGALLNPPEERQCIHNYYADDNRYKYPLPSYKYDSKNTNYQTQRKQDSKTKNSHPTLSKGVVGLVVAVIIVFVVIITGTLLLNTVDEFFSDESFFSDMESYIDSILDDSEPSVDYNDGYADEQEKLALEYMDSFINGMDYAAFDKFTALDAEKVYSDIMNNHMEYHSFSSEEQFYDDINDTYNEPVSDIHGHISADLKGFANDELTYFADMYNTDDISYMVTYSCEIDSEELYDYYYRSIDSNLEYSEKNISDYLPDYENLTDIYDICVDFKFSNGYNVYYESVWIVVADAGNGPEIVYDDMLIEEMFNMLNNY